MKTSYLKGITTLVVSSFISFAAVSQSGKFAPLDENFSRGLEFHKTDTILVVYPDSYILSSSDSIFIEAYPFWGDFLPTPVYTYKCESELDPSDEEKKRQYYGPFFLFSEKAITDIPIKKCDQGFSAIGQEFTNPQDALVYYTDDAKRFFVCKNNGAWFPLRTLPVGFYPFNILRGNEFLYNGWYSDQRGEKHINDLRDLRKKYFKYQTQSRYFDLFIADSLGNDSISTAIATEIDNFTDSLCSFLNIAQCKIPRSNLFFYAKNNEINQFLAQPASMTIYGKSVATSNHVTGLNMVTLKHEVGHTIIDFGIAKCEDAFWQEGFRQCTDYFFDQQAYSNDMQTTYKNILSLTPELLTGKTNFFFNFDNYPLSGIFTHYVIERVGQQKFINAYSTNQCLSLLGNDPQSIQKFIEEFVQQIQSTVEK